nr:gp69 [uncultured Mediterranean phage uvMED]
MKNGGTLENRITRMEKGKEYNMNEINEIFESHNKVDQYLNALVKMLNKFDLNTKEEYAKPKEILGKTFISDTTREYFVTFADKWDKVFYKENDNGTLRIYCWIDSNTGLVYKPNNAKSCAKGERADIYIPESYKDSDLYGGWLYRIQSWRSGRKANTFRAS